MKRLKRIIALILSAVVVCTASGVYAEPVFNASLSLNTDIKNSDITSLSYNEAFDVTLNLKTGKNYFAGPFSTQVFYTNSVLKNTSADFNKSGKLYSCAKKFSDASQSYSMKSKAKEKFYPADWDSASKNKYDFCNITMVPNSEDCTVSPESLNETIITLHFSSGTNTGSGTVFISADSVKSTSNVNGETYLSCLTDGGKVLSSRYDFGSDAALDLNGASLSFTVKDSGDVDNNKKINSSDALMIMQHITQIRTQSGSALKRCDINEDNLTNSADALAALQLATNLMRLNDIIKK